MSQTLAIDFDGVIHAYREGWKDGTIYDLPVKGAFDSIRTLMQKYTVYIFTVRNIYDVASWLRKHGNFTVVTEFDGTFWSDKEALLVTNIKLPAVAYLDDRGIRFSNWEQALCDIKTYTSGKTQLERHNKNLEVDT